MGWDVKMCIFSLCGIKKNKLGTFRRKGKI